ncbi:MAG: ABC transporter ATP-binding protein [Candidatus Njordarchaeales archaeon]
MIVVSVENLRKYFGEIKAVDRISFSVRKGEIFGLIGPNGAGKTTTLRILATLLKPTDGKVTIFGYDVVKDAMEVRKIISYLPEEAGAYAHLTGYEYLNFMASFIARDSEELRRMVELGAEISGLGERLKDKIKTYSKGMKRRLLLARALMSVPKLAILDEPTSGLDVIHAYHVREMLKEFARKHEVTIILSSHNMLEIEYVCDRVALIHKGRIIMEGAPRKLCEELMVANLEEAFVKKVVLENA